MDIFEIAMKMELDGKAFYLKGAAETTSPELKTIYETLADEEDRHFLIFKEMKGSDLGTAAKLLKQPSETVKVIKNIFQQFADDGVTNLGGESELEVWTEALRLEEKAESMYREEASKEPDADRKRMWNLIADEEKNHVHMISNIISFMVDPSAYAQSQQFSNFMSFEGHWED